jgi:hypothetical protein
MKNTRRENKKRISQYIVAIGSIGFVVFSIIIGLLKG